MAPNWEAMVYVLWWPFMTETKCSYQPSERWAVCDAISLSCVTKCSSFRWLETTFCSKCQSWKVTKAHKPSPPYIYRFSFTWGPAKLPDQKLSKEAKDNILKLWYPLLINITKKSPWKWSFWVVTYIITFWVNLQAYLEPKFQNSGFKNGQNTAMHREGCYFVIFF